MFYGNDLTLHHLQIGSLAEKGEDMIPLDIAFSGEIMGVMGAVIIVKVAGDHIGKHFFQNPVIPFRLGLTAELCSQPRLPFRMKSAIIHDIGVTRIIAEPQERSGELFFDLQQGCGLIDMVPDIFYTDRHIHFFRIGEQFCKRLPDAL